MISKQTIFIAGLATIVLLSIFWGYIKPTGPTLKDVVREERASFDSHVSPTPQHPDVRRWVLRDFHKIVTIPSPEVLKAPERTRVASDGTIFVLDIKDHSVKVFSPSGTAITTVPDPNRRSIDFALSQDGTMWFADANSSLIGVTSEGKKMPGSSSPLRAMRVEAVGNNLLLMLRPDSDEMFASYSDAGNTILRFGHMLEHQKTTGAAVTGEIAADEESNALFHAATYAGILDSYDSSGTLQFVVQTIAAPALYRGYEGREQNSIHCAVLMSCFVCLW